MFTFRAMNTDVEVTATWGDEVAIASRVAATFAEAEARFSRFREDSELSTLNRAQGPLAVSHELFDVLTRARAYVEMTDGLFDPGVGQALIELGYDRSFAPGWLDRHGAMRTSRVARFSDVVLDAATRTVERPGHVQIDLGGFVKGRTVDAAALHLCGFGAIDAGGDAVLRGSSPTGDEWLVEIEDPEQPARTICTIAVSDASVATSAANRRRWRAGRKIVHHLIDPRTQAPANTDLLQATVVADTTELADVLAKTAFLLGSHEARRFLERHARVGGVLVLQSAPPLFVGTVDVREVSRA